MTDIITDYNFVMEYLKLEDSPQAVDVIFILGGASLCPVRRAAELYKQGYAKKIAFISVGGNYGGNKIWGKSEDKVYKETLIRLGIPEEAIISKGLTDNTLEEAKAAIPFLVKKGIKLKRMILVSRPAHQRRAYATFSKQHPKIRYINCPANERINIKDNRPVEEVDRLIRYAKKGDIKKQKIPVEVKMAVERMRIEFNILK
jgi:uncharacterized SAM-binding protein YcdF (DUF218 family)